jgi:hypothetical protein
MFITQLVWGEGGLTQNKVSTVDARARTSLMQLLSKEGIELWET